MQKWFVRGLAVLIAALLLLGVFFPVYYALIK